MAANKKPRKPHRSRGALFQPMDYAMKLAGKLRENERNILLGPVRADFDKLRRGALDDADMQHLIDCFSVAQAMTGPGINLLPDHLAKFDAAKTALEAIRARHAAGGSWTCYAAELTAIDTGIEFHAYQLQFASVGELVKATKLVDGKIRGENKRVAA